MDLSFLNNYMRICKLEVQGDIMPIPTFSISVSFFIARHEVKMVMFKVFGPGLNVCFSFEILLYQISFINVRCMLKENVSVTVTNFIEFFSCLVISLFNFL